MRNKKKEYIFIGALVGAALAIVLAVVIVTVVPARKEYNSTKADKYDFNCLTEPREAPLTECKKEK